MEPARTDDVGRSRVVLTLLACFTLLLLLTAIIGLFWVTRIDSFSEAVNELRARGEPTTLLDLAPAESVASAENAATWVQRTAVATNAVRTQLAGLQRSDDSEPRWTAAELAQIQAAFAAQPQLLEQIEQATRRTVYVLDVDYGAGSDALIAQVMNGCSGPVDCIRVLDWRFTQLLSESRYDEASALVEQAFVLACFAERPPFLVTFLSAIAGKRLAVQMAERLLKSSAVLTEPQHARLETLLSEADNPSWHRNALRSERALTIERMSEPGMWLLRRRQGLALLAAYERELAIVAAELQMANSSHSDTKPDTSPDTTSALLDESQLVRLMQPALASSRQVRAELRATLRRVRTWNQRKREGHPPEMWEEEVGDGGRVRPNVRTPPDPK